MKTLITLLITLLISISTFAQQGINYKALIKDTNGNVLASSPISIQFIVYEGEALTDNVYQESHTINTDVNGFVMVNIGQGATGNDFSTITWASDDHFLNVQVNTGSGLKDLGTTQFMAVPYALNALSSSDNYWTKNGNDIYTSNNEVGINNSNPEHTLDVRSTSQTEASQFNLSNSDKSRYLRFFSGSDTFPDPSMSWAPGNDLLFATYDDTTFDFQERMRISLLGDVGIGITDPEAKLDIAGGDWNLDAGNPGDFRIGSLAHNFRIGVATGGGGAGITRMYANSNSLILGANDTPSLLLEPNGEIKAPSMTNTLIDNAGNKSLITKEYADATYSMGAVTTKEIMIPATSFTDGSEDYYILDGVALKDGWNPLYASIELPVGAIITEISAYFFDNTATNFNFVVKAYNPATIETSSTLVYMYTDNSSDLQVLTSTTPIQITSNLAYYMLVSPDGGASPWPGSLTNNGIRGVKIKYTE